MKTSAGPTLVEGTSSPFTSCSSSLSLFGNLRRQTGRLVCIGVKTVRVHHALRRTGLILTATQVALMYAFPGKWSYRVSRGGPRPPSRVSGLYDPGVIALPRDQLQDHRGGRVNRDGHPSLRVAMAA